MPQIVVSVNIITHVKCPMISDNPFIELAPVLDAIPQINSCMITTNKNTHV